MVMLNKILGYISVTKIYGVIPLDIICHLLIGYLLTLVCIRFKIKVVETLMIVTTLALLKEYKDSFILGGSPMLEHIKDVVVSILPVFITFYWLKKSDFKIDPMKKIS